MNPQPKSLNSTNHITMKNLLLLVSLFTLGTYYAQAAEPNKGTTRILALGDSITEGSHEFDSYTFPLLQLLRQEGFDVEFVGSKSREYPIGEIRNCGYSGSTVEYLASVVEELYTQHTADIVLLHAGHNHFIEEEPVEGMIAAHRAIIDTIHRINPQAIIIVAQVITSGKLPKYSYIPELNDELRKMVKQMRSENVLLVNQARGFDWREHTIADKVHPNKEGSRHMAERWMKSLRRVLRK